MTQDKFMLTLKNDLSHIGYQWSFPIYPLVTPLSLYRLVCLSLSLNYRYYSRFPPRSFASLVHHALPGQFNPFSWHHWPSRCWWLSDLYLQFGFHFWERLFLKSSHLVNKYLKINNSISIHFITQKLHIIFDSLFFVIPLPPPVSLQVQSILSLKHLSNLVQSSFSTTWITAIPS